LAFPNEIVGAWKLDDDRVNQGVEREKGEGGFDSHWNEGLQDKKMDVNPIQNSDTIRGFDENHHTYIMMSVSIYIKIINWLHIN
jgi:hypothetical protein